MTDNIFSEILDKNSPSNSWISLPVSPLDDKTTGMQVPCPPFSILSFIAFLVYFFIQFISFLDTDVVAAFRVRLEHFYIVNWFLTSLLKSPLLICKLAHRLLYLLYFGSVFFQFTAGAVQHFSEVIFLHISFYWIYCYMHNSWEVTFLTYLCIVFIEFTATCTIHV